MTSDDLKHLKSDPDGLLTYEYIANHIEECDADLPVLIENIINVDRTGQFTASAARYLEAIDPAKYAVYVRQLAAAVIDKDREHAFLPGLVQALYGENYLERAEDLAQADDIFRRIYKRLYPNPEGL